MDTGVGERGSAAWTPGRCLAMTSSGPKHPSCTSCLRGAMRR